MHIRRALAAVVLFTLFVSVAPPARIAAQAPAPPKLVVVLVVDQMRGDYLTTYAGLFQHGFKRLTSEGAWYQNAAYPYLNTVTCTGHSTIGTGALPYRHGMILNAWYDRNEGRSQECTDDPGAKAVSYNGQPDDRTDSAKRMKVPTLAEQIRKQKKGRVFTLSLKPRSAIGLAGHKADSVVWFDGRGGWETSTAYTKSPVPVIENFVKAHPVSADSGKVWERTLPAEKYLYDDQAVGERAGGGWTTTFPHALGAATDRTFYAHWQTSPFADEYLERMAEAIVHDAKLGRGTGTDFLGVSFSTLDMIGHSFGPRSHEVQDILVRLDATIGRLLTFLDQELGRGNYVLALSADHGVAELPEQVEGAGREPSKAIVAAVNGALQPILGEGPFVAAAAYTDIYFGPGIYDRVKSNPRAWKAVEDALLGLPGIVRVFRREELLGSDARSSDDRVRRAAALSYFDGRSGDIIIIPREHWLLASSATTHGTLYPYDQHVPLILFGAAVRGGAYPDAAMPPDIGATIAAIVGVELPDTDGHVLGAAQTAGSPSR